ncbi:MAG: hypothetical protein IJR30_01550 [Prevotella sp.]|nr:hypothetical protein [Prevotella sp.]
MKKVSKILKIVFWSELLPVVTIIILFECGILDPGILKGGSTGEFILLTIMELVTLGVIPLALYLFKIKRVRNDLYDRKEKALQQWGLLRMDLLSVPMIINTLLYYLFMNVSFGYLAIILFICVFFIYPSEGRCIDEVTPEEDQK